jgi:hypothetical protein
LGKTWAEYEVNQSSGLSLAPIFVIVFPLMKITNDDWELKLVTGLRGHFGYLSCRGVEGKYWPKLEVIWGNGLSPASFLVNLSPELIFVSR